jgi:hypothetical protein
MYMPAVTYTNYFSTDISYSFLFFGEADLYSKKTNFFYFLFLLRSLIYIDSWFKKAIKGFKFKLKKQTEFKSKKKKGFFRLKSSKPLKAFGGRFYNINNRFKVRLRRVELRLSLINELLMRYCKLPTKLLVKYSTRTYISGMRKSTELVQYKKSVRFFFVLERRLQIIV